jgi:hypothetical protein
MSSANIYSGQCVTVENVTINSNIFGTGVAQAFQFRYEFGIVRLFGLNTKKTFVVMTRPVGSGSIVHAVIAGSYAEGQKTPALTACKQGNVNITAYGGNWSFSTNDAILVRTEGRITIESFTFNDTASFLFFNYT